MDTHMTGTQRLALLALVAAALCSSLVSHASLFWHESFDYPIGDLTNVAAGVWDGFSGAGGLNVVSGNLDFAGYAPAGGRLEFGAASLDARRAIPASTAAYASLLVRCDKIPAGNDYLFSFYNAAIGYIVRVFAGNGADQSVVRYGVASAGGTTVWGPDFPTGSVVKLTIKYDAAAQSAALWFNNRDLNEHAPDVSYTAGNLTNTVTFFAIRQGSVLDNGKSAFLIDEIRVGSSWQDAQLAGIPRLTITEIMSNSRNTTANGDWFEVYNADISNVWLDAFTFDDSHAVTGANLISGITLAPGEAFIVYDTGTARQVSAFYSTWSLTSAVQVYGLTFANGLGNADSVYLWDAQSNLVTMQSYPSHQTGYSREWGRGGADLGFSVYGENGAWSNTYGDVGSPGVTVEDPSGSTPTNVLAWLAPVGTPAFIAGVNQPVPCLISTLLSNGTVSAGYASTTNAASFTAWSPATIVSGTAPYFAAANLTIPTPGLYYLAARWTDGAYTYFGVSTNGLTNAVNAAAVYTVLVTADIAYTFPVPYVLSGGPYGWSNWPATSPAGTYPPHMVFHRTPIADPGKFDEMYANYTGAYNLTSASRMRGLDQDGVSWVNTSGVGQGYLGAAVLGLNTLGSISNTVSWTCGLVAQGDGVTARVQNVVLQYSLVPSNAFVDVPGAPEFTSAGKTNGMAETYSVILPLACDNQPQVFLRWKYYHVPVSGASGTRPQVRLDDVTVSGIPEPAALGLLALLAAFAARRRQL